MTADARRERKDRSRERILASAGSLLREKGVCVPSVAEVMGEAGMTVGGFYAHFRSKQELMAEALRHALRESRARLEKSAAGLRGAEWIRAVARSYLSRAHRDHPEAGCPLPASLGEIARGQGLMCEALAGEMEAMVGEISARLREEGPGDDRSQALALLATMVGGLTLARALRGSDLSDQVLLACRRHIENSLPAGREKGRA